MPVMFGISSLIASFVSAYQFVKSREILPLRLCGMNSIQIFTPIYLVSTLMSMISLLFVAEIIPHTKLYMDEMHENATNFNPLIMLQKHKLPALKTSYVEMETGSNGSTVKNVLVAYKNPFSKNLSIFLAEQLTYLKEKGIDGKNVSTISYIQNKNDDYLILDNQQELSTSSVIGKFIKKSRVSKDTEIHTLTYCLKSKCPEMKKHAASRIFKSTLPLIFAITGICFGLAIGSYQETKNYFFPVTLIFIHFVCLLMPKSVHLEIQVMCYILSSTILLTYGLLKQNQFEKGKI